MNVRNLVAITATVIMLGCPVSFAQSGGAAPPQQQNSPQENSRQLAFDTLLRELGEMLPGGVDSTPARSAAIKTLIETFLNGQGAVALEQIKALAQTDPTFPPSELVIASLQFSSNNIASGRQTIEAAAIEHPNYPGVFLALARLAINEGRAADGLAQLEKAYRLITEGQWSEAEQKHFQIKYLDSLADIKIRYQKWDEALTLLNEIGLTMPNDPKLLVRQAEVMYRKNEIDQSIQLLARFADAMKANGNNQGRKPELMLATWLNRDDKPEEAENWIVAASNKYPDDVEVTAEFANWMVGRERFADAKAAISKIEQAKGQTVATKFIKGKIAFAQADYQLAESYFSELSLQEPGNFELANLWALSLIESGGDQNNQRSLELAQRNVQVQPKNGVSLGILGWVYYRLGDGNQAQNWLNRASQTGVESAELSYFVAKILNDQGQKEESKAFVEQALQQKGIFLYRSAAKQLLQTLNTQGAGDSSLPLPNKR